MSTDRVFTAEGTWTGGYFELLIDVSGGTPAHGQVTAVAAALWSHPDLDGPYPRRDLEPHQQRRCDPSVLDSSGTATVAGVAVPCRLIAMSSNPDFLPSGELYPPDQLTLCLPHGSLSERVWQQIGGFPFQPGQRTPSWQEPLDDWFAAIAAHTFARERFRLTISDFELDADDDLWRSWTPDTVPAERRFDLHLASGAELVRFRRTVWC
jgi:hypothetical protein